MYADYEFYTDTYGGTTFTDETTYNKYGSRASDFLDYITSGKLKDNLPSDEDDLEKVQKACCAAAEAYYEVYVRKTALDASAVAGGMVKSLSSGGESVSFEASPLDKAIASGEKAVMCYVYEKVLIYLDLVADDEGYYYLYRGI